MLRSEEELVETALLRYAQQAATKWGAKRFAAEFERRNQEERWLDVEASGIRRAPTVRHAEDVAVASHPAPVDDSVQDRVIGPERETFVLRRPRYERHPSVPRPPTEEPQAGRRRGRGRRRDRGATNGAWMITPAEAARMSPASRRLHGLAD
ncbi:MAG: hypothetical protein ACRDG8_07420 [Actinomycetota bacterium]